MQTKSPRLTNAWRARNPELEREIDKSAEMQYNKKAFSFQYNNFPGESESGGSEAHRLAVWWANREGVEVGEQTLISMNDNWYLVEKFDDATNHYQVEDKVSGKEFNEIVEEMKQYGRSGKIKSIQESVNGIDKLNQQRNIVGGEKSSLNGDEIRHGKEDNSIQRMGKEESQRRETSNDRNRDSETSDKNRKGKLNYSLNGEDESQETINEDIRYQLKDIDKYTEKSYNDYGWVVVNDVLTGTEYKDFNKKFSNLSADIKKNKTANGEYIIPVNNMYGEEFGVDNILVYAKGNFINPIITKVVKINLYNETDIELVRGDIYEWERTGWTRTSDIIAQVFGDELVREYSVDDCKSYQELARQRQESQRDERNDRDLQDRARSDRETQFSLKGGNNSRVVNFSLKDSKWKNNLKNKKSELYC